MSIKNVVTKHQSQTLRSLSERATVPKAKIDWAATKSLQRRLPRVNGDGEDVSQNAKSPEVCKDRDSLLVTI
jgi:hypothetical protein